MQHDGSSQCSQKPDTELYPEPVASSSIHPFRINQQLNYIYMSYLYAHIDVYIT